MYEIKKCTKIQHRGHTCIYPLEESILGMSGLPFPAVAGVKVLREELHFLLQHLLHRPVRDALRIHQHGFLQVIGPPVRPITALSTSSLVVVRHRLRDLCVRVALRLASVCVIPGSALAQTHGNGSDSFKNIRHGSAHPPTITNKKQPKHTSPCHRRQLSVNQKHPPVVTYTSL